MNTYKLNYSDKETATADLITKGVYTEIEKVLVYANGTKAVVEIGKLVQTQGTHDNEGNIIIEPIYYAGVFYDILTTDNIEFSNEVFPTNCVHSFA